MDIVKIKAQSKATENKILKQIGTFLHLKRKERNLSMKAFHDISGIGEAIISDLENGKYMPRFEILTRYCIALDISFNELAQQMQINTNNASNSKCNRYNNIASLLACYSYNKDEIALIVDFLKYIDFRNNIRKSLK